MAHKTVYFALGFGQRGCIPNGSTAHAVTTRREVREAIESEFHQSENAKAETRKALADFGLRNSWGHAKRFGFSSIFRELDFGSKHGEILNFMGMTEEEYNNAIAAEDY